MTYVDLHMHTYYSDGRYSPEENVNTAVGNGLELIAISDHDHLRGYFEAIEPAKRCGIGLVPAVEITTIEHHLLALSFDPYNKGFAEFINDSRDNQRHLCGQRVDLLRKEGVPITLKKIEMMFPNSTLGKYCILKAMIDDPDCNKYLLDNHDFPDGKINIRTVWSYYLSEGRIFGVIKKERWIDWDEAVSAVHKAGGLAFTAHPSTKADSPKHMLNLLKGVDGIEVQPFYKEANKPFIDYAKENNLLISFGSDYHGSIFGAKMLGREENIIDPELEKRLRRY